MPNPRLLALVTALLLVAGTVPSRADYSIDQLREIEQLILRKDCGALWQYLNAYPNIMAGNDPLARELRIFSDATARGQLDCFAARTARTAVPAPRRIINFATVNSAFY